VALRDLLKRRRTSTRSEWLASEHASLDEWVAGRPDHASTYLDPSETELGARSLAMGRDEQARLVCAAVERMASACVELGRGGGTLTHTGDGIAYRGGASGPLVEIGLMRALTRALMRRKLPFDAERATCLAEALEPAARGGGWFSWVPLAQCVTAIERAVDEDGMTSELRQALGRLEGALLSPPESYADERKAAQRLRVLLGVERKTPALDRSEPWAATALEHVGDLPATERDAWGALLDHAGAAKQSRPSKRWRAQAREQLDAVGRGRFAACMDDWFGRVREVGQRQLVEPNATVLRGLVWMCAESGDPALAAPLGRLAEACMVKIPDIGARSTKVANAATNALAELPDAAGAAQLTRLRGKAKVPSLRSQVEGALAETARGAGVSVDELEESAVPDLGFDSDGRHTRAVGDYAAVLEVAAADRVEIGWIAPDGKRRKSVPKAVRESAPDELREIRATAKEARELVAGQRDRLERLLTADRTWRFADWRERYLDHPLVGTLARRLVWRIGSTLGAWWDGQLVDVSGARLDAADEATVALWHPIESDVETVRGWRAWIEERLVTQPFKQAHREIYLLTDAERETSTYSNRFAGHVVRQHQLAALCRQRGWRYELRGWFDSWNEPTLELPRLGLRAELLLVGGEAEEEGNLSASGVYVHMGTDQVRFVRDDGAVAELESVPARVFSEVMRDVDLFVSVTSIGTDPTWADRGEDAPYVAYWRDFAFGELSELARTRRDTLVRLVPKLAIADRCEVSDRHLVVHGERGTYRIHIGSANVMMEPGSRYLCIVPGQLGRGRRGGGKTPFVPFEGDGTLALILSKAFLLARDSEIDDEVILAQMR
jgi:hypothetical protein